MKKIKKVSCKVLSYRQQKVSEIKINWLLICVSLLYNGIRYIDDPKTRSKPEDSSLDKEVMGVLHDNSLHYDSGLRSLDIKLEEKEKSISGRNLDGEQVQEQNKGDVIEIEKNIGMFRKYDYGPVNDIISLN